MNPFEQISKIDALAQCPKCKRIWSYDGIDALLDFIPNTDQEELPGTPRSELYCRNCGTKAKLFQEVRKRDK